MNARQRARREGADVPGPGRGDATAGDPAGPGTTPELIVTDDEIASIRQYGYDQTIAAALAYRDQARDTAYERLRKRTADAYAEWILALQHADNSFDMTRRAAMHACQPGRDAS